MAESNDQTRHTAGAFDIRTFIAALMVVFGVVVLLAGVFGPERTTDSDTDGHAINITVGIVLIVFAVLMQGWAMIRPTVVDEKQLAAEKARADDGGPAAH